MRRCASLTRRRWPGAAILPVLVPLFVIAVIAIASSANASGPAPVDSARAADIVGDKLVGGDATGKCFALGSYLLAEPTAVDFTRAFALGASGWVRDGLYKGTAEEAAAAWKGEIVVLETDGAVWITAAEDEGSHAIRLQPFLGPDGVTIWIESGSSRQVTGPEDGG